jgi:hypothetical protein
MGRFITDIYRTALIAVLMVGTVATSAVAGEYNRRPE